MVAYPPGSPHPPHPITPHDTIPNPHRQAWLEAARDLQRQVHVIDTLDTDVEAARRGLNWRGAGEAHFRQQADARHRDLQNHNAALRDLANYLQYAADVRYPAPVEYPLISHTGTGS